MTRLFILSLAICSIGYAHAQDCPIKKGFAYQRSTIPGHVPRKTLDESGKEIEVPVKGMTTYFIYVEAKKNCILQITRIWISGKAYHVMQEEILNTPVVIQHSHPGMPPDTLIKKTGNKVFRIQPKEEWQPKPGEKNIKKQTGAKIIIEYVNKSRTDYYKIKDIKRIAPAVLQ